MKLSATKWKREGEKFPLCYLPSYYDTWRAAFVCYPIGIHVLVRWFMRLKHLMIRYFYGGAMNKCPVLLTNDEADVVRKNIRHEGEGYNIYRRLISPTMARRDGDKYLRFLAPPRLFEAIWKSFGRKRIGDGMRISRKEYLVLARKEAEKEG